jgi:leucyl/phenylalanyl-tRNA--protein transferase
MLRGPDPNFPYLDESMRFQFPLPEDSKHESFVTWGGNLSPGMLLSAYEQGLFPWYNDEDPVLWHSPEPRFIIFRGKLHVSESMKKVLRQRQFEIALDRNFEGVIRGCAEMYRPNQGGTWITPDVIEAFTKLHSLGWAHSAEAYLEGSLVGGCYGIRLGNAFFGESMFSKKANASKAAFLTLAQILFNDGVAFIDCQLPTPHLKSLGGEAISRIDFLSLLRKTMAERQQAYSDTLAANNNPDRRGNWDTLIQI